MQRAAQEFIQANHGYQKVVSSQGSSFAPLQKPLIAVADPTAEPEVYAPFDGEAHLMQTFQTNEFDAFYSYHEKILRPESSNLPSTTHLASYLEPELTHDFFRRVFEDPYSGDKFEFHVEGPFMSDAVYNMIADRIVAARGH